MYPTTARVDVFTLIIHVLIIMLQVNPTKYKAKINVLLDNLYKTRV